MNTNFRIGNILLVTLLACGLMACTSQESNKGGTGGSGGGGGGANGEGTLCAAPPALITDFTYNASAAGTTTNQPNLSSSTTFSGAGTWDNASPSQLTSDVTQGNWHISGTLSNYAGFNLFLRNCDRIDASMYKGISFTISGSDPQGVTFGMGTVNDTPTGTWMSTTGGSKTAKPTDAGRCTPTSGSQYYHPGCGDPQTNIPVTSAPTVQSIKWATLTGGAPDPSVTPSEITTIWWSFVWADGTAPYSVDIVLDDLKFIQ